MSASLVNDESTKCRKLTALAIKSLLQKVTTIKLKKPGYLYVLGAKYFYVTAIFCIKYVIRGFFLH